MFLRGIVVAVLVVLAAGCQYRAEPQPVGAFNVYTSFDSKLPGKYLLYVDATALDTTVRPTGLECSAHSYPLVISQSFASAARQTLANLVGELEQVQSPVDRSELAARGARGMIVVRGEHTISRLRAVTGFWSATMEADVEVVAGVTVDGRNGRLLGTTVAGNGRAETGAGGMCEGGASALADAATQAMRQNLTRIGEGVANSERVRAGM